MPFWRDCLDDDQLAAATRARKRENTGRAINIAGVVVIDVFLVWRPGSKQMPDPRDIDRTVSSPEEAVVADAVLTFWQNMDEKPADELGRLQRHGFMSTGPVDAVIPDAEGDAMVVHADQSTVGDGHTVRIGRQVRQHSFGSGKRFLGVDHPVDFAQRCDGCIEGIPVDDIRVIAEELQLPCFVRPDQPFQNKTPVQTGCLTSDRSGATSIPWIMKMLDGIKLCVRATPFSDLP